MSFFLRWIFAFALLALTWNPTQVNFVRWAMAEWQTRTPFVVLAGLVLLVGYIVYLRATLRSIGPFGMVLVLALVGTLVWAASDLGWIDLANPSVTAWLAILALSVVLGVGLSWSIIRRRLSGQVDTDDVEDDER